MTMADLIALGAPTLREDCFYRVTSDADGFVWVEIRQDVTPSWRTLWRSTHRVVRVLCKRTHDPITDVREGCEKAVAAIDKWVKDGDYWSAIRRLEGDHR